MNNLKRCKHELINKIKLILNDYENFYNPFLKDKGDIIIKNKKFSNSKGELNFN